MILISDKRLTLLSLQEKGGGWWQELGVQGTAPDWTQSFMCCLFCSFSEGTAFLPESLSLAHCPLPFTRSFLCFLIQEVGALMLVSLPHGKIAGAL